ncbi:NAD(P)-binding domain-containing protein [Streptomyces endophyticus]|uniref:NAD(P)-binding domain-containing protein n=1 Tax=Streptomyces endophyticus TaxID=714166 RepID=A0ABU6EXS6_9ACTN|nr:NAD(P)-binding domain-containing protein [Streptomyces endophyticus]MEB8336409.1 NAD(P)-binding domain-containing protein [Streptomyces endophyticus]
MDRIGIIGVGELGRALVTGVSDGVDSPPDVFLSPRGARTAAELSRRFANTRICADNQEVADRSTTVIIAVRPQDRAEALAGLRVDDTKIVVSAMAGVGIDEVRALLGTRAPVVRAIPLPAVRERRAVTVTCPGHPAVDALFARLGGALPVPDEATLDVFQTLTSTLTTHYRYLATLTDWAAHRGVAPEDADRYVRGLFGAVGRSLDDDARSVQQLAGDHETPGGTNERIRTTWFTEANAASLTQALDDLRKDLGRPGVDPVQDDRA